MQIFLMGYKVPAPLPDREEMYTLNGQRIEWGLLTGRLAEHTKGVSKTAIDGVDALLMDIEVANGRRLLTWTLFPPNPPDGMTYAVSATCDSPSYAAYESSLNRFVSSLRVNPTLKEQPNGEG